MDEWEHLRDYVDTRFDCIATGTEKDARELARRLDTLNHAHEQAVEVQHTYLPREVFDRSEEAADRRHSDLIAALQALTLEQTRYLLGADFNRWREAQDDQRRADRRATVAALLAAVLALITAAATIVAALVH